MRNLLFFIAMVALSVPTKAQFNGANSRLSKLELKKSGLKTIKRINLENQKFVLIKDFEDHTERLIISVLGNKATYVEVFDDKDLKQSTANVFSGDWIKTDSGVLSFRFDHLEGQPLPLPVAKNFIAVKKDSKLVLVDVNTKEQWISHESLTEL